MKNLILDFEMAKAVRLRNGTVLQEIIEVGAVLLDENGEIIREYSKYIKPQYCVLTEFIRNLTGISQRDLDTGISLYEAINDLMKLTDNFKNCKFSTWSRSDLKELKIESKVKGIDISKMESVHEDIQEIFSKKLKCDNQVSLKSAIKMLGLEFKGREHSAIADARNTAFVYNKILKYKI